MSWSVIMLKSEVLQLLNLVAGGEEMKASMMQNSSGQLQFLPLSAITTVVSILYNTLGGYKYTEIYYTQGVNNS